MGFDEKTELDDLKYSLVEFGGAELHEKIELKDVFNICNSFIYEYDYGDGWEVNIELLEEHVKRDIDSNNPSMGFEVVLSNKNSDDTIETKVDSEISEKVKTVMTTMAPICTEVDGLCVFDDVGGVYGFCSFLKGIHGEENSSGFNQDSIEWV